MDVLLLVPPFTDPSQPGAAVPSLAAGLHGSGARVAVRDLNLDCWEYLLDEGRQRRWVAQVSRRLAALDRRASLSRSECEEYTALADASLRGRAALDELAGAPAVLRSPAFHDARAYLRAMNAIDGALAVLTAVYHPAQFEWGRFFARRSTASSRELLRAARAAAESPFPSYARARVRPLLAELRPALVGISITYLDQLVPAFAIAAQCRRTVPGARVVVGGQIPSAWGDAFDDEVALWRLVDGVVCGDGEEPLRAAVAAVRDGRPLWDVPGLRVRGAPPRPAARAAMAKLPCPDYGVLPLERYLAPEPVLTVGTSRGCYWDRCAFCAVSPAFRGEFRARPAAQVRSDLETLAARHGARHFCFADDALPRSIVRALAAGEGPATPLRWQAELRWDAVREKELPALAAAGARNLVFGFESGSPRTLAAMRKGADLGRAERLLARCRALGIGTNLQCFLGFPGESRDDALATLRFLEKVRGSRVTVSCGLFDLHKGSPVHTHPEDWNVRIAPPPAGDDLPVRYDHAPRGDRRWLRQLAVRIRDHFAAEAPQLRCGIHAHALLWLGGPAGGSEAGRHDVPATGPLRARVVVRRFGRSPVAPRRRALTVLAYALDRRSPTEIGEVAATVLAACDAGVSVPALLAPLAAQERRRVRRVLAALVRRGLLAPPEPPASSPTNSRRRRPLGTVAA
jgi:Radical SAM superfamily